MGLIRSDRVRRGRSAGGARQQAARRSVRRVRLAAASCLLCVLVLPLFPLRSGALAEAEPPALPRSPRPADATLYFISPSDGERVSSPVVVRFGLGGMGVAPSGVERESTGHHHLIVDAKLPPLGLPVPKSEHYRHFGGGQTEATIELPPGRHTLQLLLGDHLHIPHDPPVVSERITIEVVAQEVTEDAAGSR